MDHQRFKYQPRPFAGGLAAAMILLAGLAVHANPGGAPQSVPSLTQPAVGPPRLAPTDSNAVPVRAVRGTPSSRPPLVSYYYTFEEQSSFKPDSHGFPYDQVLMHETFVQIAFPLCIRPAWRLFSGLDLQWNQFDFQGAGEPRMRSETKNMFSFGIPLRLSVPLPKGWTGAFIAAPAIYSDMDALESDALRFTGMALGSYRWSPQLNLSAGVAYGRIMGREMPFPIAGLTWDPLPEWRINLMFPNPGIIYSPTQRLRCMAIITPSGNEWDVSEDFNGKSGDFDLRFRGFRTGLRLEYEITKHLLARCASGLVFHRSYELREDGNKVADADVEETWFAQVGLAWR